MENLSPEEEKKPVNNNKNSTEEDKNENENNQINININIAKKENIKINNTIEEKNKSNDNNDNIKREEYNNINISKDDNKEEENNNIKTIQENNKEKNDNIITITKETNIEPENNNINIIKDNNKEQINNNINIIKENNSEEDSNNNIINLNIDKNNENKNNIQSEEGNLNINKEKSNNNNKSKEKRKKYNDEAKKYININTKDDQYSDIIKNEPDSLFLTLKESLIMKWESKLFNNFSYSKITSDQDINSVEKNTPFQRIIGNDSVRTRVRESILIKNYKDILENMMTYYCKEKNVFYKQGLNEIFGPIILMKYKIKSLKLSKLYLLGEVFIDRFLSNYYYEKDFYALKSSLSLFVILLKYHEPSVFNRLDKMEIMPEMYATNWIMTLLSGKVKIDILFDLWDYIIDHDDPLFIHYILVSLFKYKRELIINCDKSLLPPLISNLTIFTKKELKDIVDMADELIKCTPYSFRVLANELGILKPKNTNLKEKYEEYKPQLIPAMPIFPQEVFYLLYDEIKCPDPHCENEKGFQKTIMKDGTVKCKVDFSLLDNPDFNDYGEKINEHICEKCNLNLEKNLNFLLIDLRILEKGEESNNKIGLLPKNKVINYEQEELKSEELNEMLADKYIGDRGKCHFIFLTASTDTFTEFESKFYKENLTEQDKLKMLYGLMEPQKVDKELDLKAGNLSSKEIYKLKEYDNLRKTLKSMQKQNYPYVSYVYGGFYNIHKEILKTGIKFENHIPEKCSLCLEEKAKKKKIDPKKEEKEKEDLYNSLWAHKKKVNYSNLTEYFKDPDKILISFGSLIEYKGKSFQDEKIQLLIATLLPQFKIEIYKFEKTKHIIDKKNYYDLGLLNEEQKDRTLIILEELKVSDIIGLNVDKKTKNLINFNLRIKDNDLNKKKKK